MAEASTSTRSDFHCEPSTSTKSENLCFSYNLRQYAVSKFVEKLIVRPRSTKYFSESTDEFDVANEYIRFLDFVEDHDEPGKTQLTELIFPVFIHFYLMLIQISAKAGYKNDDLRKDGLPPVSPAHRFYKVHAKLFKISEEYEAILDELYNLETIRDVRNHDFFKRFWELRYTFRVSSDVYQNLESFLDDIDSDAFSHLFRFHFALEDVGMPDINVADIKGSVERDTQSADSNPNDSTSMDALLWEMRKCNPRISGIVITQNVLNFTSVDFSEDFNAVFLAHGCPYVSVANVEKQKKSEESEEQNLIDDCITSTMKKIDLPGPAFAVKYIPRTPNYVLVSSGTSVILLDTSTGSVMSTYQTRHSNSIWDIDVNSCANFFATASADMSACLWSFNETEAIIQYTGHKDHVHVVKFHPNGIYLATGSADTTVRLWSIERGRKPVSLRSFIGHTSEIHRITYSPDGKTLASADSLGIIKIWDIRDNCKISEISCYDTFEHEARVASLCFSHDGSMLAACNFQGVFRMWDVKDTSHYTTKHFENIPLLIKPKKYGVWNIVFKENTV